MRGLFVSLTVSVVALAGAWGLAYSQGSGTSPEWALNTTIIEACSCPMFCQCYFGTEPAGHITGDQDGHAGHGGGDMEHFCKFNMAFKINEGNYGSADLTGIKFWVGGDLGDEFGDGEMKWAVLSFEPSATPEQRAGVGAILGHLYPVKWASFSFGDDGDIAWEADNDQATATFNGGKTAEIVLKRFPGMSADPVVIKNLKYWGAARNTGFVMMPNEVEAWRVGDDAFEFKGTNGFMITVDLNSKDAS